MPNRVVTLGDVLVEVMRKEIDRPLSQPADFVGPFPSGAACIFIDAVARLGGAAGCIGVAGADDFGDCVAGRLQTDGVDTTYLRRAPGYTTGTAFVAYRSDGSRKFVFHLLHSAAALLAPGDVDPTYVAGSAFVHVTGSVLSMSETARQACYEAIRLCKAAGGRVSFDPNIRPELLGIEQVRAICEPVLAACDLLLPSGAEAAMLSGDQDEDAACRSLLARGIPLVALKRGASGSRVYTSSAVLDVPSLVVSEVDPTGAGDCYGGAFVVGLLEGWELARVARFANVVGALSVTRQGPMEGTPRRAEALARM